MTPRREHRIKKAVEDKLLEVLKGTEQPPRETLQAVALGIKYLAVQAKLGEAEWGKDFENLDLDPARKLELDDSPGLNVSLDEFDHDTTDDF